MVVGKKNNNKKRNKTPKIMKRLDFCLTQSSRLNTGTFRLNLKGIDCFDLGLANLVFIYEFTSLAFERASVNFWIHFHKQFENEWNWFRMRITINVCTHLFIHFSHINITKCTIFRIKFQKSFYPNSREYVFTCCGSNHRILFFI